MGRILITRVLTIRSLPDPIKYDRKLVLLNGEHAYLHDTNRALYLFSGNSQRLVALSGHSTPNDEWTFSIIRNGKERTTAKKPS